MILVVEDEPDHRAVARMTLRLAGYDVCEVGNGEDALARLDDLRPDAVVLDIRLPGIDGLAVLAHIRSSAALADIGVVLCSAHATAAAADAAGGDRRTSFVAKPFHPDRLIDALDTMLPHRSGEDS
jgi:two-component system chemotaxis response regulator CheY